MNTSGWWRLIAWKRRETAAHASHRSWQAVPLLATIDARWQSSQ